MVILSIIAPQVAHKEVSAAGLSWLEHFSRGQSYIYIAKSFASSLLENKDSLLLTSGYYTSSLGHVVQECKVQLLVGQSKRVALHSWFALLSKLGRLLCPYNV